MAMLIPRISSFLLLGPMAISTQVNLGYSGSQDVDLFTSNPVCTQNNCINPLTPGLTDLPRLGGLVWQCTIGEDVRKYAEFCKGALNYDPAIPSPSNKTTPLNDLVAAQDSAASTMYFYHLSGLGLEGWENQKPNASADKCIRQIYMLTCFTYFPKQEADCKVGVQVPYSRPCRNACSSYLSACKVECCDNSAQCVFESPSEGGQGVITGYVDADGPSALCTGSAPSGSSRIRAPVALLLALFSLHWAADTERSSFRGRGVANFVLVLALALCASSLQGCELSIPSHRVPNWLKASDYLVEFSYVPPVEGNGAPALALNSCSGDQHTEGPQVCSGRGHCETWEHQPLKLLAPTAPRPTSVDFCKCDDAWADPECRTRRKSQIKVFFLSIFTGLIGADRFYLGQYLMGILKLAGCVPPAVVNLFGWSSGGWVTWVAATPWFGFWLFDIIRTGSSPVYAAGFKVQGDLAHWVFVLIVLVLFSAGGLIYSVNSFARYRNRKRAQMSHIFQLDESRVLEKPDELLRPVGMSSGQSMWRKHQGPSAAYGATLPSGYPNAGAPVMRQTHYL